MYVLATTGKVHVHIQLPCIQMYYFIAHKIMRNKQLTTTPLQQALHKPPH